MSQEHRWHGRERDHDERRGDIGSDRDWYGGRDDDDDRARDEYGGGQYGTSRYGKRAQGTRYRDSAYGDDDTYGRGAMARDRDFERDFAGQGGNGGRGWYGGEHGWYAAEHTGGGMSGSGRGAGYSRRRPIGTGWNGPETILR